MGPPPQRIQHQHIQAPEPFTFCWRYLLDVGDVGQVTESVPEHAQVPVLKRQRKRIDSGDADDLSGRRRDAG